MIVASEFPPQPGGIGNHAYNLASQLCLSNCEVFVIADQRSLNGEEEQSFDETLKFTVHRIKIARFRFFMYLNRFYKLMTLVGSADVVIASGKFSLWTVGISSWFKRKQYISVIHGTEVNFQNKYLKNSVELSLKRFDHIIAVSNYTKSLIAHLNLNVSVIPNGYDQNKWSPKTAPSQSLKGSPKLVTVGNVTSRKGQMNVISHLPSLKLKYPNIHYHCIGLPTQADEFLRKAELLQVERNVTFHGRLDDEMMHQMLLTSDIFVMLSSETQTGDVEGFGIAVIEANALGIPAIGSSGSGLEDAIAHEKTGFLINPNNTDEFIEKMSQILEGYPAFRQSSIQWAYNHQWNHIIKRYLKIIHRK